MPGVVAEIDDQVDRGKAIIYIPDICIAEAFKVLARKYYSSNDGFRTATAYKNARKRMSEFVRTPTRRLKSSSRLVRVHDISTTRDSIIAVDRFFELIYKNDLNSVSIPDLIVLATAKYLIDYYRIPRHSLHIITMDDDLWRASTLSNDVPRGYNPDRHAAATWFISKAAV